MADAPLPAFSAGTESEVFAAQPASSSVLSSLAGLLRHADTGTCAKLRRFHPADDAQAAVFEIERLLLAAQAPWQTPDERLRWAVVLHCLAIVKGLHDTRAEAGAVLARLDVSEARMRQLVEADAQTLMDLMPRIARRLAAARQPIDWQPLAALLLHAGTEREETADRARQRLVRGWLEGTARAEADA